MVILYPSKHHTPINSHNVTIGHARPSGLMSTVVTIMTASVLLLLIFPRPYYHASGFTAAAAAAFAAAAAAAALPDLLGPLS